MSARIEIVRFEVPPEHADELVEGHERARLAMDAIGTGWIWSRLARFDERRWLEVVAWRDQASFERVFAAASDDPVAGPWFDLAAPGWTIALGDPVEDLRPVPPQGGTLELISVSTGEDSALVAAREPGSLWSLLIETDDRSFTGEEWERSDRGMVRLTIPAPERGLAPPSWTEVADIAHSFDSADAV